MSPAAIFLIGPTACGKSALAEELAMAWPIELISMDSAQIYRGMDIGTAKPDLALRQRIPHHLIDILDPSEAYSAAAFARDARQLIGEIHDRGHLPLITGGTFLYMQALLEGLHAMPAADPVLRAEMERDAAARGWPALHADLAALDGAAAARIHPNDAQRIQRALEVARLSGHAPTRAWSGARVQPWTGPVLKLAILPQDRARLRAEIGVRFEQMMQQGLLDEVRALHARADLHADLPAIRSVGYRQLWQHLQGRLSLDEAVERAIIASRQYAKRQMTWLRRESGLNLLPQAASERYDQAVRILQTFLRSHGA